MSVVGSRSRALSRSLALALSTAPLSLAGEGGARGDARLRREGPNGHALPGVVSCGFNFLIYLVHEPLCFRVLNKDI